VIKIKNKTVVHIIFYLKEKGRQHLKREAATFIDIYSKERPTLSPAVAPEVAPI
jgi:hypothetical protein